MHATPQPYTEFIDSQLMSGAIDPLSNSLSDLPDWILNGFGLLHQGLVEPQAITDMSTAIRHWIEARYRCLNSPLPAGHISQITQSFTYQCELEKLYRLGIIARFEDRDIFDDQKGTFHFQPIETLRIRLQQFHKETGDDAFLKLLDNLEHGNIPR